MPKLKPHDLDTDGIKVSESESRKLEKWMGWDWQPAKKSDTKQNSKRLSDSERVSKHSLSDEKRKKLIYLILGLSLIMLLIGLTMGRFF